MKRISKSEWKHKIEKELRGKKSLLDLNYTVGKELDIDILLQEEDRIENDELYSFPEHMGFGIRIENPLDNKNILKSLENGASCLMVSSNGNVDWTEILLGVQLQMIDLFTHQRSEQPRALRWPGQDKMISDRHHLFNDKMIIDIQRSMHRGTLVVDMANAVNQSGNKCILLLYLNDAYILTIGILRALRIALQRNDKEFIIATISKEGTQGREYSLIGYTAQAHAAQAGGSNYHFYPCNNNTPTAHIASMMNVSNVINMESNTGNPIDPWKGAYIIEHMTSVILDTIEKGGH